MEFTVEDVLDVKNNGKEFICISNGSIVKNDNGVLLIAEKIEYIGHKTNDTVNHQRTNTNINWSNAALTMFWINAKYKELI